MAARDIADITRAFAQADAPGSPVMNAADLMADPHVQARGNVIRVDDDELGSVRMQGVVPRLSETPGEVRHAGQALGASNESVYGELLGLGRQQLDELRRDGVI
jgi:crotonobetainyl-CoA:carnitine CoA-transferase CaiB-like acyl-CoA transferase